MALPLKLGRAGARPPGQRRSRSRLVAEAAHPPTLPTPHPCPQGYIYVEAFKEAHVKEALRGLRMIYGSKPPQLVPLKEMVDAIRVMRGAEKNIGAPQGRVRTLLLVLAAMELGSAGVCVDMSGRSWVEPAQLVQSL